MWTDVGRVIVQYQDAVSQWLEEVRAVGAHGTRLIDYLVWTYPGNGAATDSADGLLRDLVDMGAVVPARWSPTTSQRAFMGLVYPGGLQQGFEAGKRACWWYEAVSEA